MQKETVKKTLNFYDGCGNIYHKTCAFKLHDGVLNVYNCPAIAQIPGHITFGAGNQVFIHSGFEDDRKKELFNRNFLKTICKNCTMKDNTGR